MKFNFFMVYTILMLIILMLSDLSNHIHEIGCANNVPRLCSTHTRGKP